MCMANIHCRHLRDQPRVAAKTLLVSLLREHEAELKCEYNLLIAYKIYTHHIALIFWVICSVSYPATHSQVAESTTAKSPFFPSNSHR